MSLRSRRSRLVTIGATLCLWAQAAAAAEGGPQGSLDVRIDGDRLSVDLGAVPLAEVLRVIAAQTGAELVVRGDLGELAPQAFTGEPLAEGIRRLIGSNGLVMTFEPVRRPGGAPRLTSLTVSGVGTPPPAGEDAGTGAAGTDRGGYPGGFTPRSSRALASAGWITRSGRVAISSSAEA